MVPQAENTLATLIILSYNVRGLNYAMKHHQVMREFKQAACSISFLQETHLTYATPVRLFSTQFPKWYYNLFYTNKAKGVAIGISGSVSFQLEEMIADDHGRYLFLRGSIGNTQCTLANIYCPNHNQPPFMSQILTKLSTFAKGITILAGDINMPLDPIMDTSQGHSNIPFKPLSYIKKRLHDLQLIDAWRTLHPKDKDYSLYSKTHHFYSRIDNIFIDHFHLPLLHSASIGTASILDHAPVSIRLTIPSLPTHTNNWKLNDFLLSNSVDISLHSASLKQYFLENGSSETAPSTMGPPMATMRGRLIELGARRRREHGQQLKKLLQQVANLKEKHKLSLLKAHLEALMLKREELRALLDIENKKKFHIFSQKLYEWGNKPGRQPARSIHAKKTASFISKVKIPSGEMAHASPQIAKAFREFDTNLYSVKGGLATLPPSEKRKRILSYLK